MFVTKLRSIQQYRNSTIEGNGIINLKGIKCFNLQMWINFIYLIFNRYEPIVRIPLPPQPNEKPSLLGFFVYMQSQAPLE